MQIPEHLQKYDWYAKHLLWLNDEEGGERADLRVADLSDANLSDANLSVAVLNDADLRSANLSGANLSGANLSGAVLNDADLSGADLRSADLRVADLRVANLRVANLSVADLRVANLSGAVLRSANLRGANLSGAVLRSANLRGAKLDDKYANIPTTLDEVAAVIFQHTDRLKMSCWHEDDSWRNGTAKPVDECGTAHCIAGWAHHLAALKRPELLEADTNVYLIGRLALGDEAASHFYDSDEDALAWLRSLPPVA